MTEFSYALTGHAKQIREIEEESFSDPWSVVSIIYEIEHSIFLVATVADTVIGYVSVRQIYDEGHINNFAVAMAYRNQGIGSKLMEYLANEAINHDITALTLEVRCNNHAAISLYQKHGFVAAGTRKNYYSNPIEDAVIMWRYL